MKKVIGIIAAIVILQGCSSVSIESPVPTTRQMTAPSTEIPASETNSVIPSDTAVSLGITPENYPRIDGSTSTLTLVQKLYTTMFMSDDGISEVPGFPKEAAKTVPSYQALINGELDLILVPDPSEEVETLAKDADVELEYVRIGSEGLVFITAKQNPVNSITEEQVLGIYCDQSITNWSALGGADGRIVPICRNADSGSQTQMDNLVLKGKEIAPPIQENYMERDMNGMIQMVEDYGYFAREGETDAYTLGYTLYYYMNIIDSVVGVTAKPLMYNGVAPTSETLLSKEYPLAISYYAVFRKDTPEDSPARKIADWLTGDEGQWTVSTAGLGALKLLYEPYPESEIVTPDAAEEALKKYLTDKGAEEITLDGSPEWFQGNYWVIHCNVRPSVNTKSEWIETKEGFIPNTTLDGDWIKDMHFVFQVKRENGEVLIEFSSQTE